jgi:hypothetical protein
MKSQAKMRSQIKHRRRRHPAYDPPRDIWCPLPHIKDAAVAKLWERKPEPEEPLTQGAGQYALSTPVAA